MTARDIDLAGHRVLLLLEKALYWPARKMLVIADIHFGKAASFRAQGVPVPRGTTTETWTRSTLTEPFRPGTMHCL